MDAPTRTTPTRAASLSDPSTRTDWPSEFRIEAGWCQVYFAYDIGFAIDLDVAERHVRHASHRESIRRTQKAPRYFQYHPPPLSVSAAANSIPIDGHQTDTAIELVLYDFGAVSVMYRVPLAGSLETLKTLGLALYDNEALLSDSKVRVQQISDAIQPAITKPCLAELVEDYVVFHVTRCSPATPPPQVLTGLALPLAQLLRAETELLSSQEMDDSLAHRISFAKDDLMIIDWNASFVLGTDMEDVLAVLEFANVELLEMRFLDDQLDRALTQAYSSFTRRPGLAAWRPRARAAILQNIARMQIDSAVMFEGVNNTLKLMGDPYLARVYRLASQRFHLSEWDATILRKLSAVESIYSKISDQQSAWRMEVLEWIIIGLIAVSILISFK